MTGLALFAGMALMAGLLLVVSGLRRRPERPRPRRPGAGFVVPSPERVTLVCASGAIVLALTRWPVAALGVGVAVALGSAPERRRRGNEVAAAEALTSWAEMLRDATGTPRGIEGVLVATAADVPELVRPHALRLARRLPFEPLDDVLGDLADDLDHPVGDLIVTALRLSARSGGREIRAVLDDLAGVAREEARMYRRIEVSRARPRSDMRAVLVIMAVFIGLFTLGARSYLAPYGTAAGQVVLAAVIGTWALGAVAMARLGRPRPVERFLVWREVSS